MNDLDPEGSPSVSEPQTVEEVHTMPDPILVGLVAAVSSSALEELSLTLYVSGTVVSGILVSDRRFFELMGDWLAAEGAQDLADGIARPVAELLSRPGTEPAADEEQGELGFTDFIHLRAARVFTSASDQPLPETLWRGRLSHVSGWSLGTMRASQA